MSTYKQPVGQKRLTNIAVVRVKKHGQRFEVACYRNKVTSWRAGIEKDIDEVLQVHTIFSNVGKGTLAKSADLIKSFGTDDEEIICRKILAEGEYQVSDKERDAVTGTVMRDVLSLVMERTVNPETLRPYSLGMLEKFAQQLHFSVDPTKNSKQQALELIRQLVQRFPIARAQMELRLTLASALLREHPELLEKQMEEWHADVCSRTADATAASHSTVFRVDPGMYRQCDAWAQAHSGRLEVLATAVHADSDVSFDRLEDSNVARSHREAANVGGPPLDQIGRVTDQLQAAGLGVEGVGAASVDEKEHKAIPSRPIGAAKPRGAGVRCSTCNTEVESREAYRDHCRSEWHKHNMKRKARQLPPLSPEDCALDLELSEGKDARDEF